MAEKIVWEQPWKPWLFRFSLRRWRKNFVGMDIDLAWPGAIARNHGHSDGNRLSYAILRFSEGADFPEYPLWIYGESFRK